MRLPDLIEEEHAELVRLVREAIGSERMYSHPG
jgi:hypothetical protein